LGERWSALREAKSYRKVERLHGLPKSRFKRLLWRLQPKRLAEYWFSRDGGIMALKIVGLGILAFFVLTLAVFAYFRKYLPNITDISGSNLGGSISYYDRTGQTLLFQDYNAVKRVPVQSKEISPYLKDATVAVEDRNFYNERGFDVKGITRAAVHNLSGKSGVQGGSTITQQLVKLTQDWTQQRTVTRKVKELILAVELERSYTKDEILTGYLNIAPYGGVDYGAQAAASDYFHKSSKDLTLPEAAMLAGIPQAPAIYSPYNKDYFDKASFVSRYNYVLDSMVQTKKITKQQAAEARKVDVLAEVQPQQEKYAGIRAPYFVLSARNELLKRCSDVKGNCSAGGWRVVTTLDTNLQKISEDRVAANVRNLRNNGGDTMATVTEDVQTGQMMALVGGIDFNNPDFGKINYAQWPISPGSSIKPYDYSALIENTNAGAGSVLYDVVGPVPGYPCTNKQLPPKGNCLWDFDRRSPGPMSIRYALGASRNIPAVKATVSVVPGNVQASINKRDKLADEMMDGDVGYHCYRNGVDINSAKKSDQVQCFPSSGIGDGAYLHLDQHLNGLATLGRLGQAIPATYILKIYNGTSKQPFYTWKQPKAKQVMHAQTAYILDNMLSDPNATYLASKMQRYKGWNVAVKTGTTNDNYDGLMMAWTTKYAVGTWVGYHTRTKPLSGQMENLTMPVTRNVIQASLDTLNAQPTNWQQPAGIQVLPAFRSQLAYSTQSSPPQTDLYPSWYKPKSSNPQSQTIDKVSGKLATNCTPALARQTLGGNATPNAFSIDQFYPPGQGASAAASVNTSASDDVHSCSDSPPSVNLTVTDNHDGTATLAAFANAGTHPFNDPNYAQFPGTVSFTVNGQVVGTRSVSDPQDNVSMTYNVPADGSYNITATVTDSVLYSASDGTTINLASGGGGSPLSLNANASGAVINFSWSGGSAPYTVYKSDGSTPVGGTCSSTSATSCVAPKPGAGSNFILKDGAGHTASAST
jgi:membrane peptidoglycan carboxypeptidase